MLCKGEYVELTCYDRVVRLLGKGRGAYHLNQVVVPRSDW